MEVDDDKLQLDQLDASTNDSILFSKHQRLSVCVANKNSTLPRDEVRSRSTITKGKVPANKHPELLTTSTPERHRIHYANTLSLTAWH